MVYLIDPEEIPVMNNIIGMNPTGIVTFNGTFTMNGPNNNIQDSSTFGYNNLVLSQSNQVVCNSIHETFSNEKQTRLYDQIIIGLSILCFFLLFIFFLC